MADTVCTLLHYDITLYTGELTRQHLCLYDVQKKEVSAEEKKAQREAKKIQKQQRVAKSLEKQSATDSTNTKKQVNKTTTSTNNTPAATVAPKHNKTKESLSMSSSDSKPHTPRQQLQYDDIKKLQKQNKSHVIRKTQTNKSLILFSHLPQYDTNIYNITKKINMRNITESTNEYIHPAIVQYGIQVAAGHINGSNKRCIGMLNAIQQYITDYTTPVNTILSRDLQLKLKPIIRYIDDCRPKSISMGNTIRWLKMKINKINTNMNENDAKQYLCNEINNYVNERIVLADNVICTYGTQKISQNDTILIYGTSNVVQQILIDAHYKDIKFDVVVCDSRPLQSGIQVMNNLLEHGISCDYILINSISTVLSRVNKAMIGCISALSNGTVLSTIGTSMIGLYCHQYNIPLIVICETYKFSERVQLDSICYNELNDPDQLIYNHNNHKINKSTTPILHDWRDLTPLKLLNLNYDCIPVHYISMIITELGCIPSASVPVILREYHKLDELIQE